MRARLFIMTLAALGAASAASASTLSVPLNHSVRLPLVGPAQSVVVGSPSVVDVAVVDSRTVYVSGKTPGDTDVTVIDPLGRVVFRGNLAVSGAASVNVFHGAKRSEAMCAPYCRETADQGAPTLASLFSAAAAPALAGATTTITSSQTTGSSSAASKTP